MRGEERERGAGMVSSVLHLYRGAQILPLEEAHTGSRFPFLLPPTFSCERLSSAPET